MYGAIKRWMALVLMLSIMVGIMPTGAYAASEDKSAKNDISEVRERTREEEREFRKIKSENQAMEIQVGDNKRPSIQDDVAGIWDSPASVFKGMKQNSADTPAAQAAA
ncbi:MAG: hypothetical protein RSC43_08570, partial [Clostridia bacterium]